MLDLQAMYRLTEERSKGLMAMLAVSFAVLIGSMSFLSPVAVVAGVVGVLLLVLTVARPLWTLSLLALYLPFEPFLLKFAPDEVYAVARFGSEGLIYALGAVVIARVLMGRASNVQTPISLPFVLFCVVLGASALINAVPPGIAVLGTRQIIRFILVFFLVVQLAPSKPFVSKLTMALFGVAAVESLLAFAQLVIGAPLDAFLLPSDARAIGDVAVTAGTTQFWDPGSRTFGTLGRYDRLGNFLFMFLLLGVGFLSQQGKRAMSVPRHQLLWLCALGLPALLMTFSRASWFAFLFGFLFITVVLLRDRRVMAAFGICAVLAGAYVGLSGLNVRFITEAPGQTLVERFYETFSYARWRGEYYGLGRVFWFVQTVTVVVPAAPIFGWGPGQYGAGAVTSLVNTRVYDALGLPFGVYGTDGYIDNNWFSLWGEAGTLGLAFYLWMYIGLFVYVWRGYHRTSDGFTRGLCAGFMAMQIGIALAAFLATSFETRTVGYYLWMYAGFLVVLLERERRAIV